MKKLIFPYGSYVIALIAVVLMLTSCQALNMSESPSKTTDFAGQPSYSLDVSKIEFSNEYNAPLKEPNYEHTLSTGYDGLLKSWAQARFKPKGSNKSMRIIVTKASIVGNQLPKTSGFKGLFTKDQSMKFDAKLEVALKIFNEKEILPEAELSVVVNRSRSIGEEKSAALRQQALDDLANSTISDLNIEVDKQIKNYFGKYLLF